MATSGSNFASRRNYSNSVKFAGLLLCFLSSPRTVSSFSSVNPAKMYSSKMLDPSSTSLSTSSSPYSQSLKQLPYESNDDYMKRLCQAAAAPLEASRQVEREPESSTEGTEDSTPKRGYRPIEEWEQDQQEMIKEMGWEQRVQFDGQRHGNQFNQNEILRRNLKMW